MARVLMFGRLADLAGWRQRDIAVASLSALLAALCEAQPELGAALTAPGVQVALDQALVRGDAPLSDAAEVAYLPPMSGG